MPAPPLKRGNPHPNWHWPTAFLVFAVALLLRAGWGLHQMSASGAATLEFPDEQQYWLMASSLHRGTGLVDELGLRAGRMPLYPALLSLAAGPWNGIAIVKTAQWFVGALGAVFALVLGARVGGRTVGLLAGLMFAADPFLVFFSNLVLTETLFVTLLVALWSYGVVFVIAPRSPQSAILDILDAHRRQARQGQVRHPQFAVGRPTVGQWFALGLLSLACVYTRESTLGLIGVALLIHLLRGRFNRSAWVGILVVGGVLATGLFPWALRNRNLVGEWCWLTTRLGISLYDGVGPQATGASDLGDVKNGEAVRHLPEADRNRYFLEAALAQMRADPGRIVKLAGRKFLRMWNPVPNATEYRSTGVRWISAVWMVPMLLLALAGVWVLRKTLPAPTGAVVVYLLLPALYLSALHMVFVGSVRYRLGAMPMLAVLAAITLESFLGYNRPGQKGTGSEPDGVSQVRTPAQRGACPLLL